MTPSRNFVANAVFALLNKKVTGVKFYSQRPTTWDNASTLPALYLGSPVEDYKYLHGTATPPVITLSYDLFIFTVAEDPNTIPEAQINDILDAVDAALIPTNGLPQNLGGTVDHVWVEGTVTRKPGWLEGKGFVLATINVLCPQ